MGGRGGALITATGRPNDATEYYVSGEGMWINQYLRGRGDFGELSDTEREYLKDLDTATRGTLADDTLYRSVDASAVLGNISDTDYENLTQYLNYGKDSFGKGSYADNIRNRIDALINNAVGKDVTERGFMSTTTSRTVAEEWNDFTGSSKPVVSEIQNAKGVRGVNLSSYDRNVSSSEAQHERLLARGQSYTITGIKSQNGVVYITVRMKK